MTIDARTRNRDASPKNRAKLLTRVWRLTGTFVIVVGAGALVTLLSTTTPVQAANAGNVTPSIYVANFMGNTNVSFPLTATGDVAPEVTNSSGSLAQPSGEAFDGSGDLWIANYHGGGAGSIVEFTAGQLASSGSPTPGRDARRAEARTRPLPSPSTVRATCGSPITPALWSSSPPTSCPRQASPHRASRSRCPLEEILVSPSIAPAISGP